jgi:hypothetical protein
MILLLTVIIIVIVIVINIINLCLLQGELCYDEIYIFL